MARKRKKQSPLEAFASLVIMCSLLITYVITKSITISLIAMAVTAVIFIVIQVMLYIQRQDRLKQSSIAEIDKMDGRQFEHYVGLVLKNKGYKVEVTRAAGDYGADIVLRKDDKKIVVQVKRYSKNVGIDAVQQITAAIAHYKAQEAWVITNRYYTKAAMDLAQSNQVRLVNRDELITWILSMNPSARPNIEAVKKEVPRSEQMCKLCRQPMILRKSNNGEFWGCSQFPKCRHTMKI